MGVTPTPNQAVHTLTATATESGWCLVGGVGNQRTGGQQTQQRVPFLTFASTPDTSKLPSTFLGQTARSFNWAAADPLSATSDPLRRRHFQDHVLKLPHLCSQDLFSLRETVPREAGELGPDASRCWRWLLGPPAHL